MNEKADQLPSALEAFEEIKEKMEGKELLLLLDFDGTLAPIVPHHDDAQITDRLRSLIEKLAGVSTTAIVSGRGMEDVRRRVDVDGIYYAGSHGFEISGPDEFYREQKEARKSLPALDRLEQKLREELKGIPGVRFENKKFALAVHYRQVPRDKEQTVVADVDAALVQFPELKKGVGKKVIELQPDVDWHKGKAVELLIEELSAQGSRYFPLYLGDDITDENAFEALQDLPAAGILVGSHGSPTRARYRLEDSAEVARFLELLYRHLGEEKE